MDITHKQKYPKLGTACHGGVYAGVSNDAEGVPYVLIKLPDGPTKLDFKANLEDAAKEGADAPTPVEALMLFYNLPDQKGMDACWTNAQYDDSDAWYQYFDNGDQSFDDKSVKLRAVRVRRLPLQSFNPSDAA